MKHSYILGINVLLYGPMVLAAPTSGPVVNLGYAQYQGVYNASSGIKSWYGIRYAQPPIGQLRWSAPVDIDTNNSYSPSIVMDASVVGPTCVQGYPEWQGPNGAAYSDFAATLASSSEDCLLLDVKVPANPVSSSLAVMVQIHGGGFTLGSAEAAFAAGDALVYHSAGSLIYVSIQYRLGAYGFLGGSEVGRDGTLNAGLQDMHSALGWVQRHISKFGGDPAKVTIIGGSAGGGAVTTQMILYGGEANPPFRAVIAEYPWWQPYHNDTTLEQQYDLLLSTVGTQNLNCLRSTPFDVLANATQESYTSGFSAGNYGFGDFYYGPYVDGSIIQDLPSQEFKQGHFTKVPLMVNRDGYEGVLFSDVNETTVAGETMDLERLFPYAKQSFFDRLYQLYPASAFNSTFYQRATLFGDFIIDCPTYYMASAVSDWGNPAYKFLFYAGTELHGAVYPFVEGADVHETANNATISTILKNYYVSFATALDPNANIYVDAAQPHWPTYKNSENANFTVLDFTYTSIGTVEDFDVSPQCDFFHSQSYVVRN